MTAKAVGKNSSSRFSVKNLWFTELICTCGDEVKHVCEVWNIFLLLTRFLRIIAWMKNYYYWTSLAFLSFGPLYLGILGFESEQWLPCWISAYLIYGDYQVVCLFSLFALFKYFWSLIQLPQAKREKKWALITQLKYDWSRNNFISLAVIEFLCAEKN